MTTNDLGYATAPVALDTCILIRNTARRMLAGVQEACSSWILLPQESIRECNVPYAAVAGKRIRRRLEREALVRWGRDWSDPQVRWLRTEGFCSDARLPFVRTADEAVAARLHDEREHVFDRRCTRIAYSICRPGLLAGRFPEPVLNVLDGFMAHLEADGMPRTAAVERERERWFKREARWFDALEAERLDLPRTRAGEDRRRRYEQGGRPESQVIRD